MIRGCPDAMPIEGFAGGLLIRLAARARGIADKGAPRSIPIPFVLGLSLMAFRIAELTDEVMFLASGIVTVGPFRAGGSL
jgi:hypothetical protein